MQDVGKTDPAPDGGRRHGTRRRASQVTELQAAVDRLRGARADADPVRRGLPRRAGRGVRAAPARGTWSSSTLALLGAASPRWSWWSCSADDRIGHRRRRGRRRRADAVPAGRDPGARRRGAAADRRALGRAGRRVRRPGRGHRRVGRATGGRPSGAAGATEVFPLTAVRARRHAALRGGERPADHVRRAGGLLAAALPALRAGPPPAAAEPGGGAQVLPARRVRLGVLPVRRGPDLRLHRGIRAGGRRRLRHDPRRGRPSRRPARCCSSPAWRCSPSACCSRPPRRRSTSGPRTSTRARRPRSPRFMAACTKVAAFGALLRVLLRRRSTGARWDFTPVLGAVAVLTMLVGAVLAVTQTDIKRLLAYSSIANAGYLLVGVLALEPRRAVRHDVLPGRVRLLGARRVRRGDAGPRRRRRGHPPVPLGRAGPAVAVLRRRVHVHPAGLRRHPADQRLHQQVRGLRRRRWRAGRPGW